MFAVVEFGFGGEGVFIQPFQQLCAVAADDFDLRIMDMRIDEAGHQNRIGIVAQVDIVAQHIPQCVVCADRADQALINQDQPVRFVKDAVFCRIQEGISNERKNRAAQGEFCHENCTASDDRYCDCSWLSPYLLNR